MNMHGRNQANGGLYVYPPNGGSTAISIEAGRAVFRQDVYTFRLSVHQTQPNCFAL